MSWRGKIVNEIKTDIMSEFKVVGPECANFLPHRKNFQVSNNNFYNVDGGSACVETMVYTTSNESDSFFSGKDILGTIQGLGTAIINAKTAKDIANMQTPKTKVTSPTTTTIPKPPTNSHTGLYIGITVSVLLIGIGIFVFKKPAETPVA